MDADEATERTDWPLRPVILAAIGVWAAVSIQQLIDDGPSFDTEIATWQIALACGIGVGALALGFALERVRLVWTVVFAVVAGAVAGLIYYWNGGAGWDYFGNWRSASLFLAIAVLVPLFQVARDEGGWRFPYADVHGHAWTNVVLWFACWLFVGIVFLLAWLLSALFDLIGIHILRDLLRKEWFGAALFGTAFGGSLGLLRERDGIVRLLQRVVTAVLGVLAPVLGVGLVLFLVALPFTGLGALWEATKSTTPILLSCVIGALILANAVIGNGAEDETRNPVLRWGAMALAAVMLPLAGIAAIAIGLRTSQYGFTPDRLWALTFVGLASAYGVAYLASLVRGRQEWAGYVRPANLRLAFVVAGIALFLATPILSFNAISTADQVARLQSGRTSAEKFDWAALAFDFGEPGKAALKRLAGSSNAGVARRAKLAAAKTSRYEVADNDREVRAIDSLARRVRVLPLAVAIPAGLRAKLTDYGACGDDADQKCTLLYRKGAREAFVVSHRCIGEIAAEPDPKQTTVGSGPVALNPFGQTCGAKHYRLTGDTWAEAPAVAPSAAERAALRAGLAAGAVEVRTVQSRRTFVGGVPVGEPFE